MFYLPKKVTATGKLQLAFRLVCGPACRIVSGSLVGKTVLLYRDNVVFHTVNLILFLHCFSFRSFPPVVHKLSLVRIEYSLISQDVKAQRVSSLGHQVSSDYPMYFWYLVIPLTNLIITIIHSLQQCSSLWSLRMVLAPLPAPKCM